MEVFDKVVNHVESKDEVISGKQQEKVNIDNFQRLMKDFPGKIIVIDPTKNLSSSINPLEILEEN